MELGLTDRTALVTGASQGIGRAVAVALAAEGAKVVLCARRPSPLAALAAEIEGRGGRALAVAGDVCDPALPQRVLAAAAERFGPVEILVNNAGHSVARRLLDSTDADWHDGLEVNLLSAVRFTRACLPAMVERRWGRIVNVASSSARLVDPYQVVYGAAKAAMVHFSTTVSASHAGDGVRCNCVLPGITRTEMVEANLAAAAAATGRSEADLMDSMLRKAPIPAGRLGEPDEVADAIVFLASANADWITGAALALDGGTVPVAG